MHSHPYPIPFYTVPSAYNERRRKPMTLSGPPSYRDITLSLSDYPKQFGTIGLRIDVSPSLFMRAFCICSSTDLCTLYHIATFATSLRLKFSHHTTAIRPWNMIIPCSINKSMITVRLYSTIFHNRINIACLIHKLAFIQNFLYASRYFRLFEFLHCFFIYFFRYKHKPRLFTSQP